MPKTLHCDLNLNSFKIEAVEGFSEQGKDAA
jgi:hypothetical protein